MRLLILVLIVFNFSCSSAPKEEVKKIEQFSRDDKVLFSIGECGRFRRDNLAKECLDKYKTHVFKGKLLSVDFAYSGVEAIVNIGLTQVTCHIHPTDQNFQMLKTLLVGDLVAVSGRPEEFHNVYSYNNLILSSCVLLPIGR